MQKAKWLMLVVVAVVVLVGGMAWLAQDDADEGVLAAATKTATAGGVLQGGNAATVAKGGADVTSGTYAAFVERGSRLGGLPQSLRGTSVDGHLAADAAGNLVLDAGVRQLFDYYLSTVGEESLGDIKGRIAFYISEQGLPASAQTQAWELLGHYLDYRQAMGDMQVPAGESSAADLSQAVAARRQVREAWLGEAASRAFFGPEQDYDDYTLARMKVEEDKSLSDAEKQERIAQLQAQLPPELREVLKQAVLPVEAAQQAETMRAQGRSQADIQAWRTDQFGAEAAERMSALDGARAAWQGRYDDYRQQRRIIESAGLANKDKDAQVQALRERLFAPNEQKRVSALDDIAAQAESRAQ